MMFKFIGEEEETSFVGKHVKYEFEAATVDTVLNHFTDFLRDCGYLVGYLEEVKEDEKSDV